MKTSATVLALLLSVGAIQQKRISPHAVTYMKSKTALMIKCADDDNGGCDGGEDQDDEGD
jgi:hypothetical protein